MEAEENMEIISDFVGLYSDVTAFCGVHNLHDLVE